MGKIIFDKKIGILKGKIEKKIGLPIFSIRSMKPRIKEYGWKYFFSRPFRKKIKKAIKNKKNSKREKRVYGSGFISHKKDIMIKLLLRDGNKCQWCFLPLEDDVTIDHRDQTRDGRGLINSDIKNLRLMHRQCNSLRGNLSPLNIDSRYFKKEIRCLVEE